MNELRFKHFFVVRNGEFIWDDIEMFNYKKRNLEGCRGYALIEEEPVECSPKQLGYYFGGIIRKECMKSECFAGWKEKEIHNHLLKAVRGTTREIHLPSGNSKLEEVAPDFEKIRRNKDDFGRYIEEVIAYLNTELNIYPRPSSHYKDNRFLPDTKIINK